CVEDFAADVVEEHIDTLRAFALESGGAEKCRFLVEELGFDGAIDYKNEDLAAGLKRECPKGIDVFFDNVGG
ncbi:hypothetical protein ACV35H_34175, partial [Pseudomonas aeruginosa]